MSVVCQNLYFSYSNCVKLVLNDVNIIVNKGEIFALIGPSGCGKTTFLRIITGICKPNLGTVLVFGHTPGSKESGVPGVGVGYMPQELALQNDLTIDEILRYYARIYCLGDEQIQKEINYWVRMLALPEKDMLIVSMSEGQKRRLSFAIGLLHKPQLILVDEPTSGVDPILSKTMWDLLEKAKNQDSSIIITTHYFSEAKRADFIAFMRKGQILENGAPQFLLENYNSRTIDELFVALSTKQQQQNSYKRRNSEIFSSTSDIEKLRRNSCLEEFKRSFSFKAKFKKIFSVVTKYVIQTKRNPIAMIIFFVSTIFTTYLSTIAVGRPIENIPVAFVVDETMPTLFNQSSSRLINASEVVDAYNSIYLPELFKSVVDPKIIELRHFVSLKEANERLKKGCVKALLYFGPNFTDCYLQSDPTLDFSSDWVENETISNGSIHFRLLDENNIISDTLRFAVIDAVRKFRRKVINELNVKTAMAEEIIQLAHDDTEQIDLFGLKRVFIPGFLLYFTFHFPLFISSVTMCKELSEDTFTRSLVSGVTVLQMLFSQALARFMFALVGSFINFYSSIWFTQISYPIESLTLILALIFLQTLAGIVSGMLLAVIVNSIVMCFFAVTLLAIFIFFANGILHNMLIQPYYLQWLNYYLPLCLPVQTFRRLMLEEISLFDHQIWPGFVVSIAWIVFPFILCTFILSLRK